MDLSCQHVLRISPNHHLPTNYQPPTPSFAGINLAASTVQHPLLNCRLYYSQVTVVPQKSIDYVQPNRNEKVIYRSFVTNSYNNITSGSSFNALVNSGIVHPTAVLICPFIRAAAASGFGDSQYKSPFDTCPSTLSALSLTNLQVSIGGQNVLNSTLNITYENFLQQVNLAEQLTSSDFGVSTGLISQGYWEASKWCQKRPISSVKRDLRPVKDIGKPASGIL